MRPPLTDADRDAIVAAYEAGEPVGVIAHRFGCGMGLPIYLAKRRGIPLRQKRKKGIVRIDLGSALKFKLGLYAKRTFTKPEVAAREAIASYLDQAMGAKP